MEYVDINLFHIRNYVYFQTLNKTILRRIFSPTSFSKIENSVPGDFIELTFPLPSPRGALRQVFLLTVMSPSYSNNSWVYS